MHIPSRQVIPGKRRRLACELAEFGVQAFKCARVVSRTDLARIPQFSCFVESNEKGAEAVSDVAAMRKARMIAVGTHGESALKGAMLGSTAHRLVHVAETPVLVVRAWL